MQRVELSGVVTTGSEVGQLRHRLAIVNVNALIATVGHIQIFLCRVLREVHVPRGSVGLGLRLHLDLAQELAFEREHLEAVVRTIADVDDAIVGGLGAVDGTAEPFDERRPRRVRAEIELVVRRIAVRAPEALHLSRVRVEHGDAFIAVAVGDERFVRLRIDVNLGDEIEAILSQTVRPESLLLDAEHVQEFSVLRELQHHAVAAVAVAADPDVALVVDPDPVVRRRPLIAGTVFAAPVAEQVARLIELHDRIPGNAAQAGALFLRGLHVVRIRAVNDPDMIVRIDSNADRLTELIAIRQRLGPVRIDFELRRHHAACGLCRNFGQQALARREYG